MSVSIPNSVVSLKFYIEPQTDASRWETPETLETSFAKKEELIREMAKALFDEMIVSKISILLGIKLICSRVILYRKLPQKRRRTPASLQVSSQRS